MNEPDRQYNIRRVHPLRPVFQPPDLPESEWCDFRKDYESGMTFVEIGARYYCDPRTVKACIIHNKPSTMLGRHSIPSKLEPYCETVDRMISELTGQNQPSRRNISAVTQKIFQVIRAEGYSGCERTVRNYIDKQVKSITILRKE